MRRATAALVLAAGLLAGGCSHGAGAGSPVATSSELRAPLARPWQDVRIRDGTPAERAALRRILRGIGATPIRSIEVGPRPRETGCRHGVELAFVVDAPATAARSGARSARGLWEAMITADTYGARASSGRLPRLACESYATRLPDGRTVDGWGGTVSRDEWTPLLGPLPSPRAFAARARRAAAASGFRLRSLVFLHPGRTLPAIVVSTPDHAHIRRRLDAFTRRLVLPDATRLVYLELDSPCGRPIFTGGNGIWADEHWFGRCAFVVGCPYLPRRHPPALTYPC